jgi:hypothetical protein
MDKLILLKISLISQLLKMPPCQVLQQSTSLFGYGSNLRETPAVVTQIFANFQSFFKANA